MSHNEEDDPSVPKGAAGSKTLADDWHSLTTLREQVARGAQQEEPKDWLDQIARRLQLVAPPPWTIEPHGQGQTLYSGRDDMRHGLNLISLRDPDWNWENLKTFLEHAPEDIGRLTAEVRRLREALLNIAAMRNGDCVQLMQEYLSSGQRDFSRGIAYPERGGAVSGDLTAFLKPGWEEPFQDTPWDGGDTED